MKNLTFLILVTLHASLFTIHSYSQSCLPEGIIFTTQAQIDSFQINYPGCTEIEGNVTINGNDIVNLNGLSAITHIWGSLEIYGNGSLTNLTGLENLISIGGLLNIGLPNSGRPPFIGANPSLITLGGLDNLTFIGESLIILNNESLVSLTGLENLTLISGDLIIGYTRYYYGGNSSLSTCEVQSICNYLEAPNGDVYIDNNAPGCNSPEEVLDACDSVQTSVDEVYQEEYLTLSPNPMGSHTTISYNLQKNSHVILKIIDLSGREIESLVNEIQHRGNHKVIKNMSSLPLGIYFCKLKTDSGKRTIKMIKL